MATITDPAAELPASVRAALADPPRGAVRWVETGDRRWFALEWGPRDDPPVLLIHGVTSDSGTLWRVGPAVAAIGRYVVAVDLPGHGRTGDWRGRQRFAETAEDVVGFVRAAGLDRPDLAVVGHSWGAMVAASLPAAGLSPRVLVLIDPPALTLDELEALTLDPEEQPLDPNDPAAPARRREMLRAAHPDWADGDIAAKVEGLVRFDREAVREVLLGNGDYDAGVSALDHPAAGGIPAWYIVGEWSAGGLIPDARVPELQARFGHDHVITIPGAPHSPHRSHIEATVTAILRAISWVGPAPPWP